MKIELHSDKLIQSLDASNCHLKVGFLRSGRASRSGLEAILCLDTINTLCYPLSSRFKIVLFFWISGILPLSCVLGAYVFQWCQQPLPYTIISLLHLVLPSPFFADSMPLPSLLLDPPKSLPSTLYIFSSPLALNRSPVSTVPSSMKRYGQTGSR